jgi:hypothetical protein
MCNFQTCYTSACYDSCVIQKGARCPQCAQFPCFYWTSPKGEKKWWNTRRYLQSKKITATYHYRTCLLSPIFYNSNMAYTCKQYITGQHITTNGNVNQSNIQRYTEKFPNFLLGPWMVTSTAFCHKVPYYCSILSYSNKYCSYNPLHCFSICMYSYAC